VGRLPLPEKVEAEAFEKVSDTELDDSNSAGDSYPVDTDENIELVETYDASSSTNSTATTADSAIDTEDAAYSYDLVETYEPSSNDAADDPAPTTAEPKTPFPKPATPTVTSTSSSSSTLTFLLFSIITIIALYATHHFRPDLFATLRERITNTLPGLVAYLPQPTSRARQRDPEEGDELESKGLMGQYTKQPRTEYGEKAAEDGDGNDGEEGYREGRAGRRS